MIKIKFLKTDANNFRSPIIHIFWIPIIAQLILFNKKKQQYYATNFSHFYWVHLFILWLKIYLELDFKLLFDVKLDSLHTFTVVWWSMIFLLCANFHYWNSSTLPVTLKYHTNISLTSDWLHNVCSQKRAALIGRTQNSARFWLVHFWHWSYVITNVSCHQSERESLYNNYIIFQRRSILCDICVVIFIQQKILI